VSNFRRRLRGAIRNIAVWGIGWSVLGFAANMLMRMTGIVDAPVSVVDAAVVGLKIGLGGGIAGAAFSAFIAFAYRNRRIQDISSLKFGVGGAVVTAASITGFVQGASLLGGGRLIEWEYMQPTLAMFSLFGFGVAAISMRLAQLATSRAPDSEKVLLDDGRSASLASGAGAVPSQQSTATPIASAASPGTR
jgi:hypothetical protein